MDPNLIHLDWERAGEALALVVVFSFIVERALAIVFENKIWVRNVQVDGLKEIIALVVSIGTCFAWKFDAVGMILLTETTTVPGYLLTGAVIAGGSKASIKLFHDVLGIKSSAYASRHAQRAMKLAQDAEEEMRLALAVQSKGVVRQRLLKAQALSKATKAALNNASPEEMILGSEAIARAEAAVLAIEQHLQSLP